MDLRAALTLLLLLLALAGASAVWVDRRLYQRGHGIAARAGSAEVLFDQLPYGLLLLSEAMIRYANPTAARLLKLPAAPPLLPERAWGPALLDAAARARQGEGGVTHLAPLGEGRTVRWWVAPWGAWDVALVEEVTEREASARATRFLMSDLSHELRTPLASLLTHLEIQRLEDIPAEVRRQSLELMQGEATRMSRMVQTLLEIGRLEGGAEIEQRPVALIPLVEAVVASLQPRIEARGMALTVEAEGALPLALGDEDRLRQLFLILLDNAIKYGSAGVGVTVRLAARRDGIGCEVRDSGPGIPAEALPQLTRRFFRAGRGEDQPGSGLGLALAAEIVRRHGSHLEIESETEGAARGTRVRFVLPSLPAARGE